MCVRVCVRARARVCVCVCRVSRMFATGHGLLRITCQGQRLGVYTHTPQAHARLYVLASTLPSALSLTRISSHICPVLSCLVLGATQDEVLTDLYKRLDFMQARLIAVSEDGTAVREVRCAVRATLLTYTS